MNGEAHDGYDMAPDAGLLLDPGPGEEAWSGLCVSCGYDLVGLPISANCPECGLAVEASWRGSGLAGSSPEFVTRLKRGAMLAHGGILLMVLAVIVAILFVTVASGVVGIGGGGFPMIPLVIAAAVGFVGWAAGTLMTTVGWWWLTSPDPGLAATALIQKSRRITRAATIADVALLLPNVGLNFGSVFVQIGITSGAAGTGAAVSPLWLLVMAAATAASLASLAAFLVKFFAGMTYLKRLAWRMNSRKLVSMAKFRIWFIPVFSVVFTPVCYVGPLVGLVL